MSTTSPLAESDQLVCHLCNLAKEMAQAVLLEIVAPGADQIVPFHKECESCYARVDPMKMADLHFKDSGEPLLYYNTFDVSAQFDRRSSDSSTTSALFSNEPQNVRHELSASAAYVRRSTLATIETTTTHDYTYNFHTAHSVHGPNQRSQSLTATPTPTRGFNPHYLAQFPSRFNYNHQAASPSPSPSTSRRRRADVHRQPQPHSAFDVSLALGMDEIARVLAEIEHDANRASSSARPIRSCPPLLSSVYAAHEYNRWMLSDSDDVPSLARTVSWTSPNS